jgi:hypothetical protein
MDDRRVAQLLELLRQRTREEITLGVMALAPSFTPEMWRALELLREEQSSRSCAKPKIVGLGFGGARREPAVARSKRQVLARHPIRFRSDF